ncbi:MAG TPA: glycosyltransferase [Coriobacteriia bacterium]
MKLIPLLQLFVLVYFFFVNGMYSLLTLLAFPLVRQQHRRSFIDDLPGLFGSRLAPGVSILVPAHNEEAAIVESVRSLLMSHYPRFEVVVIDDGSTDGTAAELIKAFGLRKVYRVARDDIATAPIHATYLSEKHDNLVLILKGHGGKADSLNVGINAAKHPYFFSIDADVVLERDAVIRAMKPVMRDPERVVASGGIVRVANGCRIVNGRMVRAGLSPRHLPVLQVVEYIRAFSAGRAGLSALDSLLIISGAFGVFDTRLARSVGGYLLGTVGEDMELLVRMRRRLLESKTKHHVLYLAYPVAWTEVPETFGLLGRQRARWQRGLCETLWHHRRMLFNPRYGHIGLFAMPFFLLVEFFGPIAEAAGYLLLVWWIVTGQIFWPYFWWFFAMAVLWGVLLSFAAVLFEDVNFTWYRLRRSLVRLLGHALLENFGYRQLTVFWRLRGVVQFLRGETSWGQMEHRGFAEGADAGADEGVAEAPDAR